ncbi:MAG: hypothetical protein V3573_05510 [Desulfovibrionaceae bacterium]
MESIFDHNPTDAELKALFGETPFENPEFFDRIKARALEHGSAPETLVRLFSLRGNQAEVKRCLGMIEDESERFELKYTLFKTA